MSWIPPFLADWAKEKNPAALNAFEYIPLFIPSGLLTPDEAAAFFDMYVDILTSSRAFVRRLALAVEYERTYEPDLWAKVFNSSMISGNSVARLIGSSWVTGVWRDKILENTNLSTSRLAAILSSSEWANYTSVFLEIWNKLSISRLVGAFTDPAFDLSSFKQVLASLPADDAQSVLYRVIENMEHNPSGVIGKIAELLTLGEPDKTVSADETLSGVNYFNSLTVESGVTLTLDGGFSVLIAKTLTLNGTIYVNPVPNSGGAPGCGVGRGGDGGGGLIILAKSATIAGSIAADGARGEDGGSSSDGCSANGSAGASGRLLEIDGYPPGKGGYWYGEVTTPAFGGAGGWGTYSASAKPGPGGDYESVLFSTPLELVKYVLKGLVDKWLQDKLGLTPTSVTDVTIKGAGGGGGEDYRGYSNTGGGGGSGGEVIVITDTVDFTGSISAKGGDGGDSFISYDNGGAGGGGGLAYLLYCSANNLSGTFDVSPGAKGASPKGSTYYAATEGSGVAIEIG